HRRDPRRVAADSSWMISDVVVATASVDRLWARERPGRCWTLRPSGQSTFSGDGEDGSVKPRSAEYRRRWRRYSPTVDRLVRLARSACAQYIRRQRCVVRTETAG